jgi:hypothetical protein
MKTALITISLTLTLSSCWWRGLSNHSDAEHVRLAIIQDQMLPTFRHYRSVVEREPGSYMFQCSGLDSLYPMCGPRGPWRIGVIREMRDKLIRNGRTNADFIADSVWTESERTAEFMYDNAIKHYFSNRSRPDGGNDGMRFVICNDQINSCKEFEDLYYDNDTYDSISDSTIVESGLKSSRTSRKLERPWYTIKWHDLN